MKDFDEFDSELNKTSGDELKYLHKSLTTLFTSRDQTHYYHLQTNKYHEHKTLDLYYKNLLEYIDELLEISQGEYGKINGNITINLTDYIDEECSIKHLDSVLKCIRDCRSNINNNAISNVYDDIESLIMQTKYMLKLK